MLNQTCKARGLGNFNEADFFPTKHYSMQDALRGIDLVHSHPYLESFVISSPWKNTLHPEKAAQGTDTDHAIAGESFGNLVFSMGIKVLTCHGRK